MINKKFRVWCEFEFDGKIEKKMEGPESWFLLTQAGTLLSYGPLTVPQPIEKEYKKAIPLFYTGLKDKNDKEICDGDIVNFPLVNYDTGKETMGTWEIKWINDEALFGMKEKGGEELIMDVNLQHLEIIGNIYENPKLLKE